MAIATFRFYAELNRYLNHDRRGIPFQTTFHPRSTVKTIIESLGVPHTEVDLILVNHQPVGFDQRIQYGDAVSVYPVFESIDISTITRLRPIPLREPKFVLDTHLGKLARYLRMLGFDTVYAKERADRELAELSVNETRILLTRDRGLLKYGKITHGFCIPSLNPKDQLTAVLERFDLLHQISPFTRCIECNGLIAPVEKDTILPSLPEKTQNFYKEFWMCNECERIYWNGSHVRRMKLFIQEIIESMDAAE